MLEKIVKVAKYNRAVSWTAEQVRRGDLMPNTPHYAQNPLDWDGPASGPQDHADDEIVWIFYTTGSGLREFYVKS